MKKLRIPSTGPVIFCVLLAGILWWVIFGLKCVNFWLGMSLAASLLTLLSYGWGGFPVRREDFSLTALGVGVVSAVVLYCIFGIGYWIAQYLFGFANQQVGNVYEIRTQAHPFLIAVILFCLTSPCEELFWRGFLQRWCVGRLGLVCGWGLSTLLYGAVHIASGNLMLSLAALVAGAFWGGLYLLTGNLVICIVSHAVWTVLIFIICPMN